MLVATSCPRRNESPVTMADGTEYLFKPNAEGVHVCEVKDAEHAAHLLSLGIYSEVEAAKPAAKKAAGKASAAAKAVDAGADADFLGG